MGLIESYIWLSCYIQDQWVIQMLYSFSNSINMKCPSDEVHGSYNFWGQELSANGQHWSEILFMNMLLLSHIIILTEFHTSVCRRPFMCCNAVAFHTFSWYFFFMHFHDSFFFSCIFMTVFICLISSTKQQLKICAQTKAWHYSMMGTRQPSFTYISHKQESLSILVNEPDFNH